MVSGGSQEQESLEEAIKEPAWTPPLCCLLPTGFVEGCDGLFSEIEDAGATISTYSRPILSDQILCINGTAAQQDTASQKVLRQLWQDQYDADEADEALFVLLVPSCVAAAVVGARGQRVVALIKQSGAQINVSREVLPGLGFQPVTIEGGLKQVATAAAGVCQVLQELAGRGRLNKGDFALKDLKGERGADVVRDNHHHDASSPTPCALVFLVDMLVAGRVIGKQGRKIAEMQRETGAKISVLGGSAMGLPGMRCGDRLVEIKSTDAESRAQAAQAVLAAITDENASPQAMVAMLVPADAVGYIIGKSGQTIKEIMDKSGADVAFNQDGPPIAGARPANISGTLEARVGAVLATVSKIDELRHGSPSPASHGINGTGFQFHDSPVATSSPFAPPMALQQSAGEKDVARVSSPPIKRPSSQNGAMHTSSSTGTVGHTAAERALLAGIQASGVLDHRLTVRVPCYVLALLDEVSRRSGASFLLLSDSEGGAADPGHQFVTVVGTRMATSLAVLYIQDFLALQPDLPQ